MYTYDKQRELMISQRKKLGTYIGLSILAVALLMLNVWICLDLSRQKINLLQQANHLLATGSLHVFWTYTIVLLTWLLLGEGLGLFKFSAVYPVIGVCGLNAVFLFSINEAAYLQLTNMTAALGRSALFWILLSVAAIVLILLNFSKVLDSLIAFAFAIADIFSLRGLVKVIAFFGCCVLYWLAFSHLVQTNSVWAWGIGLTALAFGAFLLWNLYVAKETVVMEDIIKSKKSHSNVLARLVKDIALGMAITVLIYFALSGLCGILAQKWTFFTDVKIIDVDVQELFFTELSLAFLVISFVPLLANKTDSVYWVDIIQYRLVKPNHTSIVDVSSYVFANLLLSLIAFVFPQISDLLLTCFVITIFLLGFLSIKLLISFFGVDHLKEELKEEYQMALEYRKLVCELDYDADHLFSFLNGNPYRDVPLGEFGSRLEIETEELQNMHDQLLWGDGSKRKAYTRKKDYRRLAYYARKFDNQIDKYEFMRDGLYSNTVKCIDEYKVNEICEQILLLLQYKEYDYAIDCMQKVYDQYPMVFLKLFEESLQDVPADEKIRTFLNEKLCDLLSSEKKIGEVKYKMAINNMANWAGGHLTKEMLEAQIAKSIRHRNPSWIAAVYKAGFLKPVYRMMLAEKQNMSREAEAGPWEGELRCAFGREFGIRLIVDFILHNEIEFAYEAAKEYKLFLEEIRSEFAMGRFGPCLYIRKGVARQAEICDLSEIFYAARDKFADGIMSKEMFVSFIKLLTNCYKCLKLTYTYSYGQVIYPQKLEDYKDSLVAPMVAYISESNWEEKNHLLNLLK